MAPPLPGPPVLLAVHPGLILAALAALVLVLLVLWQVAGPGPRRTRAARRAERLLRAGHWEEALQAVRRLQAEAGVPPGWQKRLRAVEGECLLVAGDRALHEKRYEDSLQLYRQAAPLTGADEAAQLTRVVEVMLAEARALFASGPGATQALSSLLARVLALQPAAAEAVFWQGLALAREGQPARAAPALEKAHQVGNRAFIDPPFYLGVLLYRQGRPQDSLRLLAEANRVDASCPFVAWQVGLSMVASNSDPGMALRVLQRALGPRGLALWLPAPHRAWVEAFPQGRSFVRRLAEK